MAKPIKSLRYWCAIVSLNKCGGNFTPMRLTVLATNCKDACFDCEQSPKRGRLYGDTSISPD